MSNQKNHKALPLSLTYLGRCKHDVRLWLGFRYEINSSVLVCGWMIQCPVIPRVGDGVQLGLRRPGRLWRVPLYSSVRERRAGNGAGIQRPIVIHTALLLLHPLYVLHGLQIRLRLLIVYNILHSLLFQTVIMKSLGRRAHVQVVMFVPRWPPSSKDFRKQITSITWSFNTAHDQTFWVCKSASVEKSYHIYAALTPQNHESLQPCAWDRQKRRSAFTQQRQYR